MANICRGLRKKKFFSPVLKSPTHIGFIGVKKNGSKISHLGTFKDDVTVNFPHQRFFIEFFKKTDKQVSLFKCFYVDLLS
jgi:hypothetical protein